MIIISNWKKEFARYTDLNYQLHCIDLENRAIEKSPVYSKALEAAKAEEDFERLLVSAQSQKSIFSKRDQVIFERHLYVLRADAKTQRLRFNTSNPMIGYYPHHLVSDTLEFNAHLRMLGFAFKRPTQGHIDDLAKSHMVQHFTKAQEKVRWGSRSLRDGLINGHLLAAATFGSYTGHKLSRENLFSFSEQGVEVEYVALQRYLK